MSFALPFSAPRARCARWPNAGLGVAAVAVGLFALAVFAPSAWRRGHVVAMATGDNSPIAPPRAPIRSAIRWRARRGPRTNGWRRSCWRSPSASAGSPAACSTGAAAATAALIVGLVAARRLRGAALVVTVAIGAGAGDGEPAGAPPHAGAALVAAWSAASSGPRSRPGAAARARGADDRVGEYARGLSLRPHADRAVRGGGGHGGAGGARRSTARGGAIFALAALAAALINPFGVAALVFPFRLMWVENLWRIGEWRAQDFSHMERWSSRCYAPRVTLTRRMAMPPIRAAVVVALIAMALQHARHQTLLGIVAPMALARPIAEAIGVAPFAEECRRARDRGARDTRGGAGDRRRAARSANRTDRRRRRADFGLERGPGAAQANASAQRLRVWRLSHL